MSQKTKQRFVLFFIPVLLNLLLIFSGLTLVPRLARANAEPQDPTPVPVENNPDLDPELNPSFPPDSPNPIDAPTIHLKSGDFQPSQQNALDPETLQEHSMKRFNLSGFLRLPHDLRPSMVARLEMEG